MQRPRSSSEFKLYNVPMCQLKNVHSIQAELSAARAFDRLIHCCRSAFVVIFLILVSTLGVRAQGVQSGTIRGIVQDRDGLPTPGVTVTASSAVLLGTATSVTDSQGGYTLVNLPPGSYEIKFELSGFNTVTQSTTVLLGLTVEQNVTLQAASVSEQVTVVAETPAAIATSVVGANFKHNEVERLAMPRTIQGISQLAPALTENSPNPQLLVINGGLSFDNSFMINGVDINDNIFARAQNLFIEDAIEETQVLTSGISAEYGRFGGGVVNAVTKSGGNRFSGSGRVNFVNPSWSTATPFEVARGVDKAAHPDILSKIWEGTFGGPIVKDRLWFFGAGRYQSLDSTVTLPQTAAVLPSNSLNKRGEIKLTGTLAKNHTLQGGYVTDPSTVTNNSGVQSFLIDPRSEVDRTVPNWYVYSNYHGVLTSALLVEAQYSQRLYRSDHDGGTSTNIADSPFFALSCACVYNAPYLDASDPNARNNRQLTASATGFWLGGGRHQTKAGYEFYRSQLTGGGSQSSTSYVFNADFLTTAAGTPALDSAGRLIPLFVPGQSSIEFYPAIKGAVLNTDSNSVYLQDHWVVNSKLSADLGARFENVRAISTGDIVSVKANRLVPRLGVGYDVRGNGDHVIHASYAQYSGRYNEAQIGSNTPVGHPGDYLVTYQGPAGNGVGFAPGFDLANYPYTAGNVVATVPTANVFMDPNLHSPLTHEESVSYGVSFGRQRGYGEVSYVARQTHGLIEDFITLADGSTHVVGNGVDAGILSNIVYRNSDLAHREYQGMIFQSRLQLTNRWNVNGHYTLQIKNDGNYEGEATGVPGQTSVIGNYSEAFSAARNYPDGHLQSFQRHRLRLWSIYEIDMGRAGDGSISGLWRVDSARVYSLVARNQSTTPAQLAILSAAGYPDAPAPANLFFGDRGSQEFAGYGMLDVSFNYNVPVFRTLRPWVKVDIFNLFDNLKLIAWNTTIAQDPASPKDNLGYATGYVKGPTFNTATGNTVTNLYSTNINAYPLAFSGATPGGRTLQVAVGFRF
jgi:hypothetical protein